MLMMVRLIILKQNLMLTDKRLEIFIDDKLYIIPHNDYLIIKVYQNRMNEISKLPIFNYKNYIQVKKGFANFLKFSINKIVSYNTNYDLETECYYTR